MPSIDVIKNITSQSVHTYAAIDALIDPRATSRAPGAVSRERAALRDAVRDLTRGERAWGPTTTVMRPSRDYVDASRALHGVLGDLITSRQAGPDGIAGEAREHALASLATASSDLAALTRQAAPLATRLLNSGILFARATAIKATDDRLEARAKNRLVPVRADDLPHLARDLTRADIAATGIANTLREHLVEPEHLVAPRARIVVPSL